jgi:proteasome lid subunit RPN8/RPN11
MIQIDTNPLAEMKGEALRTFPDECCGFLFGFEQTDGGRKVVKIWTVNNSKQGDKKRRFEISAKDYIQAEKFAMENNFLLLGIYHSHPNHPAIPSEHDRLAAQPWFSYLIISVMQKQFDHIRSWRLNADSQFEEESILSNQLNKTI